MTWYEVLGRTLFWAWVALVLVYASLPVLTWLFAGIARAGARFALWCSRRVLSAERYAHGEMAPGMPCPHPLSARTAQGRCAWCWQDAAHYRRAPDWWKPAPAVHLRWCPTCSLTWALQGSPPVAGLQCGVCDTLLTTHPLDPKPAKTRRPAELDDADRRL